MHALSIAPSPTTLFNISNRHDQFLENFSSIVPIPKLSNHKEATNYRPIFLLSRLIEHHASLQPNNYTPHEARQLSNKQWGFQVGKLTTGLFVSSE